jgi:hypothetical protein
MKLTYKEDVELYNIIQGVIMKLTYKEAVELYNIIQRRPENVVLLNLIAEAIYKEHNG